MQAEGQVGEAGLLEDAAVGSGAAVDPQAGVVAPGQQGLPLLLGAFSQAGAAGAQPPQHKLADAQVEAQDHDVDHVDQEEAGSVVPERSKKKNLKRANTVAVISNLLLKDLSQEHRFFF